MSDLISKEKVCDYIAEFVNHEYSTESECEMVKLMIKGIQSMPSAEKIGHWIIMGDRYIKCSECGHITKTESPDIYHFCMVCGANMSENPTDSKDIIWHERRNYSEIVVEPQESEDAG